MRAGPLFFPHFSNASPNHPTHAHNNGMESGDARTVDLMPQHKLASS
jgi:hypothetical protein